MTRRGKRSIRLVMAGGGTGGHLFPALALADEFKKRGDAEILFIGGRGGLEESVVKRYGYALELLDVEALKNKKGVFAKSKSLAKATGSLARACMILRRFKPDGVIGSGSYASGPVVMAARLMGIKTAVLEQNALPGFTNRFLGRFVRRVYIAFDDALDFFPPEKTRILGTPVRNAIVELATGEHAISVRKARGRGAKFTVFVFGGSQGAAAINAAFLDAAEYLSDVWPNLKVIHQTGREGFATVEAAYERKGLKVELHRFIEDMAQAYSTADLVVCRAGATTIAEITAVGLPAILIPYPFAAGDHQRVNAMYLEKRGAAVMIGQEKLTGSALASAIRAFYDDPARLKKFGRESKRLGRPRAAFNIANDFLGL